MNLGAGIAAWVLPWRRWAAPAVLVLPVLALVNLFLAIVNVSLPPSTEGVWLVLVFVWVGQWQSRRAVLTLAPVAALAYWLPFACGVALTQAAVAAVVVAVPVAVLVGLTIAGKESATRAAQKGQQEALDLLAVANLTDDLTGLGNRRQANMLLDSLRPGDALAILDLDHFKRVNDSLGHQRGDQLLQDLGVYLRGAVRDEDRVARFGGEEFVLVLRNAKASAPQTVGRLLDGWRAVSPVTTLSAGIALHTFGAAYDETFLKADAALYSAKSAGRDRLVLHLVP